MKDIIWVASAKSDLKNLPDEIQQAFGFNLYRIQKELQPVCKSKVLKGFQIAIVELIEHYNKEAYRAVYTTKIGDNIYVLHIFQKKSKQGISLPKRDKEIIQKRLQDALMHERGREKHDKETH